MNNTQHSRRFLLLAACILLITVGISYMVSRPESGSGKNHSAPTAGQTTGTDGYPNRQNFADVAGQPERDKREDESLSYTSHDGETKLKLAMDKYVTRDAEGMDEIVPLNPPASPATLRKRLAEFESPRGVYPVAYDESDPKNSMRIITERIRAEMPREEAERIAASENIEIADFPDYAPGWVIFATSDPFVAMEKIAAIRMNPKVEQADVLVGRRAVTMELPDDPLISDQWHIKRSGDALPGTDMNVEDAWNYGGTGGVLGRGVNIGIIDTGTQTNHPDFAGNYDTDLDRDFVGGDLDPNPPANTDEDHGTAVGGVAASRGNNGLGGSGVAPEAKLVGLRLITGAFTSDETDASALAHRSDVIQIKNNSWGFTAPLYKTEPLLEAALKNSSEKGRDGKGTIFTFSAGNSGDEEDSANYSELTSSIYTLVVGATDSLHRRCFYSEPGANVVITAPSGGVEGAPIDIGTLGITTADRTGPAGYDNGDYTDGFNGTSSSCPAVSGAIALILEKNPDLGWRDVHDILIRTATKFNPNEAGWLTNAAGLHFNNDYGAGLINVTAAVNKAANHVNLGPQVSVKSTKTGIALDIPNNSSIGSTLQFQLPDSNIITEHVTLRLSVNHSARGDLEIFLTSPSGTQNKLAFVRSDIQANYSDYTFSTVQNWGESSNGIWTLKIADRRSTKNTTGGTLTAAELVVYGESAPPVNTPPTVAITSPADGAVFSPGVGFNLDVTATDVDIDRNPSPVTVVRLFQNDVLIDTDRSLPFSFALDPANGSYTYVARAVDVDGLVGESPPVQVTVKNQTPVISGATLNASNQAYDDLPLTVSSVDASDPESDAITFSYAWEFSTNEEDYKVSKFKGRTLAPNPNHSGKMWRCVVTASDGNTASAPFVTSPVNLLDRPTSLPVRPGADYAYQSGLVLKGDTLVINRQAIIHEFSQGVAGGTSEWIEILTLKQGSLSGWSLIDKDSRRLRFAPEAWDDIPAGTLIVIYNGDSLKDRVLPADSSDAASGSMVVSSSDTSLFTEASQWPTLDNVGDSIYMRDSEGNTVHGLSYGNSFFPTPNVGNVPSGAAAYFAGLSDAGADLANEWLTTNASVARTSSFSIAEPAAIFPGAVFTNGQYRQDFDVEPGLNSTTFPTGWSGYSVTFGVTQTTNFDELILPASDSLLRGGVFNFGARAGIVGGTTESGATRFDPGFIALALDNTLDLTGLEISYDVVKISEQPRSMLLTLEYTTGNPNNTGTVWTPIPGTTHITGSTPRDTLNRWNNVPLPPIFENRQSPIYLRWYYRTNPNNGGAGTRDAIAIDNLVISSDSSPNIFMSLSLNTTVITEAPDANSAIGTVTINEPLSIPLEVGISSSDPTEATVPASVLIPAGEVSATFPITSFDDVFADGTQTSTITVSAPGFLNVSSIITVLDNEPIQIGVTPAIPNNSTNAEFVARLREGRITEPASFRLSDSSVLPEGLTLDTVTGLISGTLSTSAKLGSYTVVIEKRNVIGGFTSQTIVIVVSKTVSVSYSQWIAGFGVSNNKVGGDPDLDSIPNLVEYALGSRPDRFDKPQPIISGRDGDSISITYTKSKDTIDVTLLVEWSTNLKDDSWKTEEVTHKIMANNVNSQTIRSSVAIEPDRPAKFMRLRAFLPELE